LTDDKFVNPHQLSGPPALTSCTFAFLQETNNMKLTSIVVAIAAAQGALGSWFSKAGMFVPLGKKHLGLVLT
jgi:hypothetical protein